MEEAVIFFFAVCKFKNIQPYNVRRGTKCQTNVVSVGEMSTIRKAKTHETVLWLNQRCQSREATPRVQKG